MNKHVILIVPPTDVKFNFTKAKSEIVKYLGTRLLAEEDTVSTPGVVINTIISDEDKDCLQKLVFNDNPGCLVFIQIPEDVKVDNTDYIDTIVICD